MGEMMKLKKTDERGFTLIEVIVTLILVGITAAMAGMWIVSVAKGYVFAKKNMETTQKAQLALTRLEKEFKSMSAITSSSANSITYDRLDNTGAIINQTVTRTGSLLKIKDELNDDTLTNSVSAFTLSYCDDATSTSCHATWTSTSCIIVITLTLTGADNIQSTFTQRIVPRNL